MCWHTCADTIVLNTVVLESLCWHICPNTDGMRMDTLALIQCWQTEVPSSIVLKDITAIAELRSVHKVDNISLIQEARMHIFEYGAPV